VFACCCICGRREDELGAEPAGDLGLLDGDAGCDADGDDLGVYRSANLDFEGELVGVNPGSSEAGPTFSIAFSRVGDMAYG